jgi:hypothetical protein
MMTNTPHTLARATFQPNTTGAGQFAAYSIIVYPEHTVGAGGGVLVIYPSQLGVQANAVTATVSSPYASPVNATVVTVQYSSRQIMISNAFREDQPADSVLGINVTIYGFVNPLYNTEKTNSFIVRTLNMENGTNYFIDQVTDGLILNSPCDYPCQSCQTGKPSVCTSCY